MSQDSEPVPAHRPSRRQAIVQAAIRRFAASGFVDTSISDIADEAGVVVTGIYYHFEGKDELFSAALTEVLASVSEVVATAREANPDDAPARLAAVIDTVWSWLDENPDHATLLYVQLPRVTRASAARFAAFQNRHIAQAFGYFGITDSAALSPADRAAIIMRARTLVNLSISIHTLRLGDGPLGSTPPEELRAGLQSVAGRLVTI